MLQPLPSANVPPEAFDPEDMVKHMLSKFLVTTQQEGLLTMLTAFADEFATGDP